MAEQRKLAVIGFDSISLPTLLQFVERGVMPTVARLIREGSFTQTWPCFPMETGTNWACLATGASPWVTGCNMQVHFAGKPLDRFERGFPASVCKAEQLWSAAHRAGRRSVVFDWAQSYPLAFKDGIVHVGEDGRPDNAIRALQEVRAYTTHPRQPGPHVARIEPRPVRDWPGAPEGALEFEVAVEPGGASRHGAVESLWALVLKGPDGYDRVALHASRGSAEALVTFRLGGMSDWVEHTFRADGRGVRAALRGKLLILTPDASKVHLYLSEIYPLDGFAHPAGLCAELLDRCGPFIIQCSRQQVVQGGASDIATYFEEQEYLARWWRNAAGHVLSTREWDLFMLKWHGPDWTNHLTMYMIDPRHPMYDADRADEGWALWDRMMAWGDDIVARVLEVAGPGAVIALVSDHGGDTQLPGRAARPDVNGILRERGWLVQDDGGTVDWSRSAAYARGHYVLINLAGRDPQGIVEPGEDYLSLRDDIMQCLMSAQDGAGRHMFQCVLPVEDAGRLGVGGDRVGDVFLIPCPPHPVELVSAAEFWETHTEDETGTWDWPRLNTGSHSDDAYLIMAGPGIRKGYSRRRPTLITSVAPTLATAAGLPVPADADGSVLRDFFEC